MNRLKNNRLIRTLTEVFGIRREERITASIILILLIALNSLVVLKYYGLFTPLNKYYWPLFIHNFHISGFDPITYSVVSDWTAGYNVYRHPLLAFYMYVPYLINQGLMQLTGINCAIFIVVAIQIFCAFYSIIFLRRILRELIGMTGTDSTILSLFFFSFAFVMVSSIVPDHFIISMMMLLLTLYISGQHMKDGRQLGIKHTILLFMVTAGISLNNGLKTFLAGLFINRRHFFRPKYLFAAVILPSALIWGTSRWEYANIVWPRDMARNAAKARQKAAKAKKEKQLQTGSMRIAAISGTGKDTVIQTATGDTGEKTSRPKRKSPKHKKQGTPISNGEFMRWTDISTSRIETVVENLFGEPIQLHDQHLLEDEFRNRPMIVHYSMTYNYVIEAFIVLLFVIGVWCGRHSRLLWLALSWFGLDMLLHLGLGFGINEIYIMSAHWIYVMPLATAFALKNTTERRRTYMRATLCLLTLYLYAYNITLIAKYLTA